MASSNPNFNPSYRGPSVEGASPPSSPSKSSSSNEARRNRSPANQWVQDSPGSAPARPSTTQPSLIDIRSTEWGTRLTQISDSIRDLAGTQNLRGCNTLLSEIAGLVLQERERLTQRAVVSTQLRQVSEQLAGLSVTPDAPASANSQATPSTSRGMRIFQTQSQRVQDEIIAQWQLWQCGELEANSSSGPESRSRRDAITSRESWEQELETSRARGRRGGYSPSPLNEQERYTNPGIPPSFPRPNREEPSVTLADNLAWAGRTLGPYEAITDERGRSWYVRDPPPPLQSTVGVRKSNTISHSVGLGSSHYANTPAVPSTPSTSRVAAPTTPSTSQGIGLGSSRYANTPTTPTPSSWGTGQTRQSSMRRPPIVGHPRGNRSQHDSVRGQQGSVRCR